MAAMQTESTDFINLLAARAHPQTTNIHPFNQQHWFDGAYRTIQRNVPKGTITPQQKQNCQNQVFATLSTLQPDTYDQQIETLIKSIATNFPLTIGQSQKLINILLKYHACCFYSQLNQAWNLQNQWIANTHFHQHVPVDSIVLFGLCRNSPASSAEFLTVSSRFCYSKPVQRFVWNYTASIYVPDSPSGAGFSVPWSGIADYGVYFRIQTMIRSLATQKQISPLLYEMRYLWAPA